MYEILKDINDSTSLALKDGRVYVLKRILPDEADIYKKLIKNKNKYIVDFIELTSTEDGLFAVEEYVSGTTLSKFIEDNGILDDQLVVKIINQLCEAVDSIHQLGIVHRDINPNNIMLDDNMNIKLIDFGISRVHKNNKSKDTHILGTYGYAAPEQYGFDETDAKADIYSIGVLINYMKTMKMPNEELCKAPFSEIVTKCTQIDKNNRYASVFDLKSALDKKYKLTSIIRKIPGFRNNNVFFKIISSVYYFFLGSFYIFIATSSKCFMEFLAFELFAFFSLTCPIAILCNFQNWLDVLPFTANKSKVARAVIQIALAGAFVIAGCLSTLLYQPQ